MKKKIIITVLIIAIVIGLCTGGIIIYKHYSQNKNPIKVFSVSMLNYGGYFGQDSQVLDGSVSFASSQNVNVSADQIVKTVYVKVGDTVKVGDKLLDIDMTKQELDLESKKAYLEQYKTDLTVLENDLSDLYNITPVSEASLTEKTDAEIRLEKAGETLDTAQSALDDLSNSVPEDGADYIKSNTLTEFKNQYLGEDTDPKKEDYQDEAAYDAVLKYRESFKKTIEDDIKLSDDAYNKAKEEYDAAYKKADEAVKSAQTEYDAAAKAVEEEQKSNEGKPSYTQVQLDDAIKAKKEAIESKNLQIKQQEIAVKQAELSIKQGTILATVNGVVTKVDTSDASIADNSPVVTVSGSAGFQAEVSIDEWNLSKVNAGDPVSVNINGENYKGVVTDIGITPTRSYGDGNVSYYPVIISIDAPSDANIAEYQYVEVKLENSSNENVEEGTGIYLPNFMIKKENGNSYVFVDNNGKLEKRMIKTGKTLYGEATEIKNGLTEEDYIAFPYLKDATQGKKCVRSENYEELYR